MITKKDYESLVQEQKKLDETSPGKTAASREEWEAAWKQKQLKLQLERPPLKEDHTDPIPLLLDKISSLPIDSARRKNAEILKGVLENSTANVGYGTDALTRESYRDLKRLAKHSTMIQESIAEPLPSSSELLGQEEGHIVNNLQSWRPSISNALISVSDAMGSHADTTSSINKSPLGPIQFLPQAALVNVNNITSTMVHNIENSFKTVQKALLIHTPAKEAGSLRHLTTAASAILSVPFDLVSDVYNGLRSLINKVSKLLDGIMNKITSFAISAVGGLVDSMFPPGMLSKLINFVSNSLKMIHKLFDMLGGFSALAKMASQIMSQLPLGCTGNIFGMKSNSQSSSNKAKKAAKIGAVLGTVAGLGQALGNLGTIIGGNIGANLGLKTINISNPAMLLESLFDSKISKLLGKLHQACSTFNVGNRGYSVGAALDSLTDNAFSIAMKSYAAHASIISPNFNKQSARIGGYATEASIGFFNQLPYVKGAQGNKGIIMHGPGGTQNRKVFRI